MTRASSLVRSCTSSATSAARPVKTIWPASSRLTSNRPQASMFHACKERSPRKTKRATISPTRTAAGSDAVIGRRGQSDCGRLIQRRASGATSKTPIVSPLHAAHQRNAHSSAWRRQAAHDKVVPMVGRIRQLTGPARNRSLTTSCSRLRGLGKPTQRRTSAAATTACRAAARATPSDRSTDGNTARASKESPRVTRNEPRQTPGQHRQLYRSRPASATPAAGWTAGAEPGGTPRSKVIRPATK